MITYELAEKLKEAGFIQRQWRFAFHYLPHSMRNTSGEVMVMQWEDAAKINQTTVYIPDLLELIEACGNGFDKIERATEKWYVYGNKSGFQIECEGTTIEDAVAALWLQLNKTL